MPRVGAGLGVELIPLAQPPLSVSDSTGQRPLERPVSFCVHDTVSEKIPISRPVPGAVRRGGEGGHSHATHRKRLGALVGHVRTVVSDGTVVPPTEVCVLWHHHCLIASGR